MRGTIATIFTGLALLFANAACAQGGIRIIIWNLEPVEENDMDGHYGLGYDHDLNDRLSLAVTARYAVNSESVVLNYWSAYHFSDNSSTSFYLATMAGLRMFREDGYGVQVPLGFRLGVRGGLEKFYVDVYAGVHYSVGSNGRVLSDNGFRSIDLRQNSFCLGLDLGFGWARKKSSW